MKMIVGLGNPGKEYEKTRHNMGFIVIDNFSKSLNIEINKKKFNGLYETILVDGEKVILLKPQLYMNLSGEVVKSFSDYFNIEPSNILVISDDLDLKFLDYRLRLFGSSGGHNGLKNIEKNLGTNRFRRFRIGISNNKDVDTVDYVLGRFNQVEEEQIKQFLSKTESILKDFIKEDFEKVMNKYN